MEPPSLPPPPTLEVERAVAPIAFPDSALEHVLRSQLFPPGTSPLACQRWGGVRYAYNRFDLDGDRHPETLVALLGRQTCGPSGCPVVLLKEFGHRLEPMQTFSGFHNSLVVSNSRHQGWQDLLLPAPGTAAGWAPTRLSHNGKGYVARPDAGSVGTPGEPTKGVAALMLKDRPNLVQGHRLPCSLGAP